MPGRKFMNYGKRVLFMGIGLAAVSVLFTILVGTIDVRNIGLEGTDVGFAGLNVAFRDAFGDNDFLYTVSQITGYFALFTAGVFAGIGIWQLIKTKSTFKVDYRILSMGILYIVVIILYLAFDKFVINYRPVLEDGILESSYPSSHMMLAICVFVPGIWAIRNIFAEKKFTGPLSAGMAALTAVTVVCRLFSGVHWLTDIIGGMFISGALSFIYIGICMIIEEGESRRQ